MTAEAQNNNEDRIHAEFSFFSSYSHNSSTQSTRHMTTLTQ